MIRRPPRSTLDRSSAASDVYKRQAYDRRALECADEHEQRPAQARIEEAIGAVHDTSGDWRAAGEHFERAIALTEDPVEVLRLKCRAGVCYVRTGHPRGHELVRT